MSNIPYTARAALAPAAELPGIVAEALEEISDKLNVLVNSYHFLDRPLVAAALKVYADALVAALEPDQQHVYNLFLEGTGAMRVMRGDADQ